MVPWSRVRIEVGVMGKPIYQPGTLSEPVGAKGLSEFVVYGPYGTLLSHFPISFFSHTVYGMDGETADKSSPLAGRRFERRHI